MAECIKNGKYCSYLHETKPHNTGVTERMLQPNCFYCFGGRRLRKIGHKASWTGKTPNWCPKEKGNDNEIT